MIFSTEWASCSFASQSIMWDVRSTSITTKNCDLEKNVMTYLKAVRSQCTFLRNLIRSFFIFCYNILNVTVSLGILILLSWGFYPAVKHSFPTEDSKLLSRFLQSHQTPLTRIVISPRRTMELLIYRCLKPLVWGIVSLLEGFILIHLMCSSTRVAQRKISILSLWLAWKWAIFFY